MSRTYADYRLRVRPLLVAVAAGMTMVLLVLAVVYWRFSPFPDRAAETPSAYSDQRAISAASMDVRQIRQRKEQYLQSGTVDGQAEPDLRMPIGEAMERVLQQYGPDQVDRPGGEP